MSTDDWAAIRYCPKCGSDRLEMRVPPRDDRERSVCAECGYTHYIGPALAAGVVLRDGDRLCLIRRALDPGRGKWTFPGGFVDLDEEVTAAAEREAAEETGVRARVERLLGVYNSLGPRGKRVVIVVYVGEAAGPVSGEHEGVEEVAEVRWFRPDEVPWDELAFSSTQQALRDYLEGLRSALK